jgi:hypothetical protein
VFPVREFWVDSCFEASEDSELYARWGDESFHNGFVAYPVEALFDIEFDEPAFLIPFDWKLSWSNRCFWALV